MLFAILPGASKPNRAPNRADLVPGRTCANSSTCVMAEACQAQTCEKNPRDFTTQTHGVNSMVFFSHFDRSKKVKIIHEIS